MKYNPEFVFAHWCNGAADRIIAGHNPDNWPRWRCWMLNAWGDVQMFFWGWWHIEMTPADSAPFIDTKE